MNPFVIFNILQQVRHKARVCPVCGHSQLAPRRDREHAEVQCDQCGAPIPPRKKKG